MKFKNVGRLLSCSFVALVAQGLLAGDANAVTAAMFASLGAWAGVAAATVNVAISFAVSSAVNSYQQKKMARRAEQARQDAARDRSVLVRSPIEERTMIFGDAVTSGTLVEYKPAGEHGGDLFMTVALCQGPVRSITKVWIDSVECDLTQWLTVSAGGGTWLEPPDNHVFAPVKTDKLIGGYFAIVGGVIRLPWTSHHIHKVEYVGSDYTQTVPFSAIQTDAEGKYITVTAPPGITQVYVTQLNYDRKVFCRIIVADGTQTTARTFGDFDYDTPNKAARIGYGVAYVRVMLSFNSEIQVASVPNIRGRVYGIAPLDPRTGVAATGAAVTNPVCVGYHYLRTVMNIPNADIDVTSAQALASYVDVWQGTAKEATTNETLEYNVAQFHGHISLAVDYRETLNDIAESFGGSLVFSAGKWRFGHFDTLNSWHGVKLTDDNTLGDVTIQTVQPRKERWNVGKGTFTSVEDGGIATEFQPVVDAALVAADGDELPRQFSLANAGYDYVARGLVARFIKRAHRRHTIRARFDFIAYDTTPGDVIEFESEVYKVDGLFTVLSREFDRNRGITLELEAMNVSIDDDGVWRHRPPMIRLPLSVAPLTGLTADSNEEHALIGADGARTWRVQVSWNEILDPLVLNGGRVEIQWTVQGVGHWAGLWVAPDQPAYISGVWGSQDMTIQARSVNARNKASPWVTIDHFVNEDAFNGHPKPPPRYPNLVTNAGLMRSAWGQWSYGGGRTYTEVHTPAGHGSFADTGAITIVGENVPGDPFVGSYSLQTEPIPVLPGNYIEFSWYVADITDVTTSTGKRPSTFDLGVRWHDAAGSRIGTDQYIATNIQPESTDEIRIGGFTSAPAGAVRATLIVWSKKEQTFGSITSGTATMRRFTFRKPMVALVPVAFYRLSEWNDGPPPPGMEPLGINELWNSAMAPLVRWQGPSGSPNAPPGWPYVLPENTIGGVGLPPNGWHFLQQESDITLASGSSGSLVASYKNAATWAMAKQYGNHYWTMLVTSASGDNSNNFWTRPPATIRCAAIIDAANSLRVEAQVRISMSNKIAVKLCVAWYSAAFEEMLIEEVVGEPSYPGVDAPVSYFNFPLADNDAYTKLLWGMADKPAGARYAMFCLKVDTTIPSGAYVALTLTKPFLGPANSYQTQPSPWILDRPEDFLGYD